MANDEKQARRLALGSLVESLFEQRANGERMIAGLDEEARACCAVGEAAIDFTWKADGQTYRLSLNLASDVQDTQGEVLIDEFRTHDSTSAVND